MQVPPATPYGGADPEWSVSLDELSGCNVPEDASLSNGASIAFLFNLRKYELHFGRCTSICMRRWPFETGLFQPKALLC